MTRTKDPFDELAAMFLTEPDDHDEPRFAGDTPPRTRVELLVVAHLPVRGGLWLTPYADAVAREAGPTALLRLDGEHPTLQQLRGEKREEPPNSDLTLREAIVELISDTPNWIIRNPSRASASAMLQSGADQLTILTSADEAAGVAAYQVVKNMVEQSETDLGCLPTIGVAVVGSSPEDAQLMFDRLNATTREHLGLELKLSLCLPRMDAGILSTRYLSFGEETCPALNSVMRTIDEARRGVSTTTAGRSLKLAGMEETVEPVEEPVPSAPVETPGPDIVFESPPVPEAIDEFQLDSASEDELLHPRSVEYLPDAPGLVEVIRQRAPENEPETPAARSAPAKAPGVDARPARPSRKLRPKPVMEIEPKETLQPREPAGDQGQPITLAEHVDGLIPILPRCPGHERVELALDASGRMHLLTREENLRELFVVEPWAKHHRELIAMACPGLTINPRGALVRHLFTAEPLSVSDLHQSDLRLHVLAPVHVDGKTGWYVAPLSSGVI